MSKHAAEMADQFLSSVCQLIGQVKESGADLHELVHEDPLDIMVRSGWHAPGAEVDPDEFQILMFTGGPAIAIFGDLDQYGEPVSAVIRYQDWFEPWQSLPMTTEETEALLTYCRAFYFGE